MKPEEAQRLQECVQEIAAILYKNTSTQELESLEGIEKAVRQHMLSHVSPNVALFLSSKLLEQNKANLDR
jgi:hypothetical protein